MVWDLKIRKRQAPYTRDTAKENRLYGTELALCEIAFAKGYNSVTNHPLPSWKFYKAKYLNRVRNEQEAFESGIKFANEWLNQTTVPAKSPGQ